MLTKPKMYTEVIFLYEHFYYKVRADGRIEYKSRFSPVGEAWLNAAPMQDYERRAINSGFFTNFIKSYKKACGPKHPVEVF